MAKGSYVISRDYPELASEISPNSPVTGDDSLSKLKTVITWSCKSCGEDWTMSLLDRLRGRGQEGCRACSKKAKGEHWRQQRILSHGSLLDARPEIASFLANDNTVDPSTVTRTSQEFLKLVCDKGHHFTMTAGNLAAGYWCQKCGYETRARHTRETRSSRFLTEDITELRRWYAAEQVGDPKYRTDKVLLQCPTCSEAWESTPARFFSGKRCPYCASVIFKPGVNDFATLNPELAALVSPEFDVDLHAISGGGLPSRRLLLRCPLCQKDYNSSFSRGFIKKCPSCAPKSRGEEELYSFLSSFKKPLKRADRTLIRPKELDFLLPREKKAVEFNGDYWHSDALIQKRLNTTAEAYHRGKLNACAAAGVELAFVWERDWTSRRAEVEAALAAWLGGKPPASFLRELV